MASIRKFHLASCNGKDCNCLWVLDYRPLGLFGPRRRVRFKTRKQYSVKTDIEVASPYSPGSLNIFVRGQIVHVEEVPGEKSFRCGVAYAKT